MKIQAHENKNNPLERFQANVYLLVKKISVTVNKGFVHVLNPDMPVDWGLIVTLKADLEIPMSCFCSIVC
jgi:hypothetical protein